MKAIIEKFRYGAIPLAQAQMRSAELGRCEQELQLASEMLQRYLASIAHQSPSPERTGGHHA